jgi:hypothetical protein
MLSGTGSAPETDVTEVAYKFTLPGLPPHDEQGSK